MSLEDEGNYVLTASSGSACRLPRHGFETASGNPSCYISNQTAQVIQYLLADNLDLNKMGSLQIATGLLSCPFGVEAISQVMTVSHGKTWQCGACVVHGSNHIKLETNLATSP